VEKAEEETPVVVGPALLVRPRLSEHRRRRDVPTPDLSTLRDLSVDLLVCFFERHRQSGQELWWSFSAALRRHTSTSSRLTVGTTKTGAAASRRTCARHLSRVTFSGFQRYSGTAAASTVGKCA